MNHEAYEKQMINTVNRNAEEKTKAPESTTPVENAVFTKTDASTLKRGFKRTLLALLTAVMFAFSVFSFIAVASASGYLAVVLFIAGLVATFCGILFLYAQGIADVESNGDSNE